MFSYTPTSPLAWSSPFFLSSSNQVFFIDDEAAETPIGSNLQSVFNRERGDEPENDEDRAFVDDATLNVNRSPKPQHVDTERASPDPRLQDADRDEQCSISEAIHRDDARYLVPSAAVKKPFLASGTVHVTFVAGYVVESVGSHCNTAPYESSPTRVNGKGKRRPAKKQKTLHSDWHTIYLADESAMLRVWTKATVDSAPSRSACVSRLSQICAGTFVSIVLLSGPVEVRFSNPKFKKYKLCCNHIELPSFKAKFLDITKPDPVPYYDLIVADAIEIDNWNQVNSIIDSGSGIEVSCTLGVMGLNCRHTPLTARNGGPISTGLRSGQGRNFNHVNGLRYLHFWR